MKKIILILATSAVPLLFSQVAFSQGQAKHFKFSGTDSVLIASNEAKPPAAHAASEMESINSKAIRFFNKDYKNAEAVKWYKLKDGFVSYCYINGNKNKVFYDEKGRWTGSITYYNDKTLPTDIRTAVRSVYFDYTITQAEEIHTGGRVVFQVHLEDEKNWKLVDVAEGEITLVTNFAK